MKKISMLCSMILCCLCGYAQSLISVTPSPVTSGSIIRIEGSNESAENGYFYNIQYEPIKNESTSPDKFSSGWITGSVEQFISTYNTASKTPSALLFKVSNRVPYAITIKLAFKVSTKIFSQTNPNPAPIPDKILFVEVTVKPVEAPTVFYNVAKSQTFTKNNCAAGTEGSQVIYSVPASKYSGSSQSEADGKAQSEINANGQTYANTNGECMTLYYNTIQTANFTKNNCPPNSLSSELIPFTIQAGRFKATNLAEANRQALNALNSEGQANANATGICTKVTIYAKLVYETVESIVGGKSPSGNWQSEGLFRAEKGNYSIQLYSDPAGMVPFNVTNLTVNAKITKSTSMRDRRILPTNEVEITNKTYTFNGNTRLLESSFYKLYSDAYVNGYVSKMELTPGDYIIIN